MQPIFLAAFFYLGQKTRVSSLHIIRFEDNPDEPDFPNYKVYLTDGTMIYADKSVADKFIDRLEAINEKA